MRKRSKSNSAKVGRQKELPSTAKRRLLSEKALRLPLATFEKKYMRGKPKETKARYNRAWMEYQRAQGTKFSTPESKYIPKDLTYRMARGLKGQYLTRVKLWTTIPDGTKKVLYKYIAHDKEITTAELGKIINNWELDYDLIIHKWRRQGGYRHESLDDKLLYEVLAQGLPSP